MEVLKQEIDKLKYTIEHTSSKSQKRDYIIILEGLYELLDDLDKRIHVYQAANFNAEFIAKSNLNNKKKAFDMYNQEEYKNFVKILCKNSTKISNQYDTELFFNESISLKAAKDLLFEFFDEFDKSLYPTIKQALDSEHLFLINDKYQSGEGYSLCNPYTNSPYIVIFKDDKLNIHNLSCLAHELGHVLSFQRNKINPKMFSNTLYNSHIEMPSFTIEFLFLDFLLRNNIYNLEANKVIYNNMTTLNFYTTCLKIINRVIDEMDFFKEYELEEIQQLLRSHGIFKTNMFCELCFTDIIGKYSYSYGELLAVYYLYKYRQDKEKTTKDIYEFINNIGIRNDLDMFDDFGINKEEFLGCKYLKDYTEENIKTLKKPL